MHAQAQQAAQAIPMLACLIVQVAQLRVRNGAPTHMWIQSICLLRTMQLTTTSKLAEC
jgi:hypothetical protein